MPYKLPEPHLVYHWYWWGLEGPPCKAINGPRSKGDDRDARSTHISVTIFPDETEPTIDVMGTVVNKAGLRDRRFSYDQRCWSDSVSDEVWEAIGAVIQKGGDST